jgi:L-alanine-DL-glutamate epimerase-like enolase superfamily enzyme
VLLQNNWVKKVSNDIQTATEMGRLQEEYGYAFFEEPCPFDYYDETRRVTKALDMIVAGGEQEFSMRHFIWQMDYHVVDLVQPDIFYFGGLTRSIRIARAAESVGMICTPHISGAGLGFLYAVLMAACIPNAGPYHEYKGVDHDLPAESPGISFISENGIIRVPPEPGIGVQIDPDFVSAAKAVIP